MNRLLVIMCLGGMMLIFPSNPLLAKEKKAMDPKNKSEVPKGKAYKTYIKFFEEVYQKMAENYYQPVSRDNFDKFIEEFNAKIYAQLTNKRKAEDYVRWRSASVLIKRLKSPDDIFSEIYPPEPAQEYKQTALGTRRDLGVEGVLEERGFKVTRLEPRADPYVQGLRVSDYILKINDRDVLKETQETIAGWLNPLENERTKIVYLSIREGVQQEITVLNKEYFKQSVFVKPVPFPGVLCLEIQRFNQKTSEDMLRFMDFFRKQTEMTGLIIDLRGNPGGPPLAAREISSFFLPGGEDFAYFQKKNQPKQMLDVPKIPEEYHFDGPIVVLLDEKSGSSSELFAGVLQKRKRAAVIGRNSAGKVFLKSMFNFDDKSMMLLVTGRGYHPDGSVFSFQGVAPDKYVVSAEEDKIITYAGAYIQFINKQRNEAKAVPGPV